MKTKSTYTLTTPKDIDMKKAVISFECGDKKQEYEYSYYITEGEVNGLIDWKLPILAKFWVVPQEDIKVEIKYVIRLK